jgi:hypothetical protein
LCTGLLKQLGLENRSITTEPIKADAVIGRFLFLAEYTEPSITVMKMLRFIYSNNHRVLPIKVIVLGPAFNDPFSCFNWFDLSKFLPVPVDDAIFKSWVFTALFISTDVIDFRFCDFPLNLDLLVKSYIYLNNQKIADV